MSSAMNGGMSASDVDICRAAVKNLTSEKYKDKNYLFLDPFDLSQTPGYMDVVTKVMDLSTLAKNLEAGVYANRQAFFQDAATIFENAIAYHSTRIESKWIAKPAKEMLKISQREKKSAEKKANGGGGPGDADTGTSSGGGGGLGLKLPTKKNKLMAEGGKKEGGGGGTKLKLKLGGGGKTSSSSGGGDAPSAKPKVSIKLKASSGGSTPKSQPSAQPPPQQSQSSSEKPKSTEKKKKGLKLTLKLNKSKAAESTDNSPNHSPVPSRSTTPVPTPSDSSKVAVAAASSSTSPKSSSGNNSNNNSGKISIKMPGGSRGKELPKGVEQPKTKKTSTTAKGNKSKEKQAPAKKGTKAKKDKPLAKDVKAAAQAKVAAAQAKAAASKTSKDNKASPAGTKLQGVGTSDTKSSKSSSGKSKSSSAGNNKSSSTSALYRCPVTPQRKAQCAKVLSGLRRRKQKKVAWFLHPVSDKGILPDYQRKIQHPMDLNTMQAKLERNEYVNVSEFVLDLRRIFANCLQFNTSIKDSLRPIAVECLIMAEELMTVFLAQPEHPTVVFPPQLHCWKLCLSVLDTLYNLTNPGNEQPTVLYFLYPVSFYCGGKFPPDYLPKISKPMDFGTVTKNLIEGEYTSLEQFGADCRLVIENCMAYYGDRPDGKDFTEMASRLRDVLQQQLDALNRYIKSPSGEQLKSRAAAAVTTFSLPKPPIPLLMGTLEDLRALKYTDRGTKITEPAMAPFEKPVSLAAYPDYMQHVENPMDLQSVERKVKSAVYTTPEDFEYDVLLIFNNCIAYNAARKSDHLVAMGKYGIKQFKKTFVAKMRALDDPAGAAAAAKDSQRKSAPLPAHQGPSKKIKIESPGLVASVANTAVGVSRGKSAPRISLTAAQLSSATDKVPAAAAARSKPVAVSSKPKDAPPKSTAPVPLHIAIARVKEAFPLRRAVKSLQSWEANCARFFKELMRHSWISAARPKFIFHVPVPVLFPELRDAYSMKIKKPMDLTTVECTLLAGNRYATPEDFIHDVSLVFANAIAFNKDGRDIGDPLSCAYYDASIHLLRYSRWLSLELLSEHVETNEVPDEKEEDDGLPLFSWRLTTANKAKAREEMEAIILKEPIEKSLEGDRYTWMEAECEKLLKALRHQSDVKYMQFFIQPNYPPDYAAFIAKPMDWERCQRTLKKRQYDKFGDVIDDLRLIFSNATKYNARHEGTDTVSGRAFEAAKYMSVKLEVAINKMMLSVSDRLERERIDHNNAEREIEAAERAEEERIRAQWKNDSSKEGGGPVGSAQARIASTQKVRTAKLQNLRRETTDFEVPFFDDEDDGQHERSYFDVVRQQKAMFERQRQEFSKVQQTAVSVGSAIFMRMMQRDLAIKWAEEEAKKKQAKIKELQDKSKGGDSPNESKKSSGAMASGNPSSVLSRLEDEARGPLQIKFSKPKAAKRKNRPALLSLD